MSCNGYFIQAKPGKYKGHKYASQLEIRVAKLLDEHKIMFKPHVKFDVVDRKGKPFTYELDFLLQKPQKFIGISKPITMIEVKGVMCQHDIDRMEALKYTEDAEGFIVLPQLVQFWENCGMQPKNIQGWR